MKAMILAAGDGMRMRPLTENLPKPLLEVACKPLLQYHIEALAEAGIDDIIINHARLGYMIEACFGQGERFGVSIRYSAEGESPLETGGGIKKALPLLGDEAFVAINADIWTDYPLKNLSSRLVCPHVVLVPNPEHNPAGDFALEQGRVRNQGVALYTFSGIGVYLPAMFRQQTKTRFPLAPVLRQHIDSGRVSGEIYRGDWFDVGTPDRLTAIEKHASKNK